MSDYIAINNTAPEVKLWQQYRKNDASVNFFQWVQTYWQGKYFDYVWNQIVPQLSTKTGTSEYVQFFALYWYGIIRPIDVTEVTRYDNGLLYDSSNEYDCRADSGPISITNFKKIICFILNWTMHDWNIPALYRMIMDFTGLAGSAITISQDSTELDTINIGMVSNGQTILFKSIVENYTFVWGLPLGITLNITLS